MVDKGLGYVNAHRKRMKKYIYLAKLIECLKSLEK